MSSDSVLLTRDSLFPLQVGEDYQLKEVCGGKVHVDTVPGTHETCVSMYHKNIAAHMAQHLATLDAVR